MLNPAIIYPAFRGLSMALMLASCLFSFSAFAQPSPSITGDTVACPGQDLFYATDFVQGNTWTWTVSAGGTIFFNGGNFIGVKWTGPMNSSQSVSVVESDPNGLGGISQKTVLIKNTLLTCDNSLNVTLDQTGVAVITPNMMLDGNYITYEGFEVTISNIIGVQLGNTLNCSHIGMLLTAKVTDDCTGNSCWGIVKVEDKKAPVFTCPTAPVEIPCDSDIDNYPPPAVFDNCDPMPFVSLTGIQTDNSDVCNGVSIAKWWVATDDYGNESICVQHLFINPVAVVDFPKDTIWQCADYNLHPNITDPSVYTGNLSTTGSGIPTGTSGTYCQYSYLHFDDTLAVCGNTFKIIRTWTVINWCTGMVIIEDAEGDDNEQIIKVVDHTKPLISVPVFTLNANVNGSNALNCTSTDLLLPPFVSDNCNEYTVRIFTPVGEAVYVNGVDGKDGGYVPSPGLHLGAHTIVYKAVDACDNVAELPVIVQVVDKLVPIVVCDEFTNVNLDVFGHAEVFAATFDDGSHDNCCLGNMLVKRMGEPDTQFGPTVLFDCADSATQVILRVFDCFGNHNECMVTALVTDKIAPTCIPPPQKIIPCTDLPPDITEAWVQSFGGASFYDNCGGQVIELPYSANLNACGEGHIERKFVAADNSGNLSGTCVQHIYVTPTSDWIIHFPPNWEGECGDVVDAGEVTIDNFGCDQIAMSHSDQFFALGNDSACYKIVRTWKIINWCHHDPYVSPQIVDNNAAGAWIDETTYNNFGNYEYQQIIKIHDTTPPVLSFPYANEICTSDSNCLTGHAYLPIVIEGECSNDFEIVWHLDINNDLTYDQHGTGFYEGDLPIGTHKILYIVEDGCSNDSEITVEFTIKDCKAPTALCENGLLVEIMQTGMIEVCASSFNYASFDNCPGPLTFSFSADTTDKCRTYFCNSAYLQIPIQLWVTDAAGNQDFCETFLQVQDNMFSCDSPDPIQGKITTHQDEPMIGVEVQLNHSDNSNSTMVETDNNGNYVFHDVSNGDYTVAPHKNDDPLNGVTTFDIVQISRHILGVTTLSGPYQRIAADINNSKAITTLDLVELRKMVLFINTSFPNNQSWRFIRKDYVFPEPTNPWQETFPEIINLNNFDEAVINANFTAVKIGDINGNASTSGNFGNNVGDRSAGTLMFETENMTVEAGSIVPVTLRAKDFNEVYGFQFTIDFDTDMLEFQSVVPTDMTDLENFGTTFSDDGAVMVSWYDTDPATLSDGEAIITLDFLVKNTCQLQNALTINSRFTPAEAYIGEALEVWGVDLGFTNGTTAANEANAAGFELFQNVPNPFSNSTLIGFKLPENAAVTLTVFDQSGKVLMKKEGNYPAGKNEIPLNRQDLPNGVVFYRLETAVGTATKKMTIVN